MAWPAPDAERPQSPPVKGHRYDEIAARQQVPSGVA